ncbi:Uncharacterised protein [Yersinia aldovae]|uniref:hypothetical protein n=1 Tax=Yersinia aldovae TaxID=29483 RepID=UPI0005E285D5|nr:hypothetical protein [Yersinia aldovae]CNJ19119.1 Uncharacterised protein [Yersinia aldovae]
MKKTAFISLLLVSSALVGCAPKAPSQVAVSTANYGVLPADYQEQIKVHMSNSLKDPDSAKYTFLPTFKGYSQDGSMSSSGGGVSYGYVAPVLVNAKNSYGGYTGNQKYVFIFSGGVMYDTTANDMFGRVKPVN